MESSLPNVYQEILKLVLILYKDPTLYRSVTQTFIENISSFIDNILIPHLKSELNFLEKCNSFTVEKVMSTLESNKGHFEAFSTEYKRFNILNEKYIFLEPEKYIICTLKKPKILGSTKVDIQDFVYGERISLAHSLKLLIEIPGLFDVMHKYLQDLQDEKIIISNFVQGRLWKRLSCDEKKYLLLLFISSDDCELGNCLGSHVGKIKVGTIYVCIPCLPPHVASKLSKILMESVHFARDRKKYGNEAI